MSPRDIALEHERYRAALEKIESMKHVRRAYRHTKYEDLIKIAQDALAGEVER